METTKTDAEIAAEKELAVARAKHKEQLAELQRGRKFVTLRRASKTHTVELQDGRVVQASMGNSWQGTQTDRLLDWADRSKLTVYVSDDPKRSGVRMEAVPTPLPRIS